MNVINWPARRCSACMSDACAQGRRDCPTPEACRLAGEDLETPHLRTAALIALGFLLCTLREFFTPSDRRERIAFCLAAVGLIVAAVSAIASTLFFQP